MAKFDGKLFLEQTGQGADLLPALGTSFGMPDCMLALGERLLNLLPTPILNAIKLGMEEGIAAAEGVLKNLRAELKWLLGLEEVTTVDGLIIYISEVFGLKVDAGNAGVMQEIGKFLGAIQRASQFAGQIYNNIQAIQEDWEGIKDCIDGYRNGLEYTGEAAIDTRGELTDEQLEQYISDEYGVVRDQFQFINDYITSATAVVETIDMILLERERDPSKEPQYIEDLITTEEEQKRIFRLAFGPPRTTTGQFLQSIDGYYFDSQVSGLVPALLEIKKQNQKIKTENRWTFEHDPNLGGKGKQISIKDVQYYVNTILDPEKLDESDFLKKYYKADTTLKELIGTRDKRVLDIKRQIEELTTQPNPSQAVLYNLNQVLLSESSHLQQKIDKRKKQIELAIKMPSIYKGINPYRVGKVPVNDFSYLEGLNFAFDIEKQKALVLDQESVSGVVKPLSATFVVSPVNAPQITLDHLLIHGPGLGSIIYDSSSFSGIDTTKLSISPVVVDSGLIAMYNFMQSFVVTPSSTEFKTLNSGAENNYNNAQLNSTDPTSVFREGLAIPYLDGITRHSSVNPTKVSSMGNFVKLPDTTEFKDFLYSPNGATFETWVKVPDLTNESTGFGPSSLYRLILACENTGIAPNITPQKDPLYLRNQGGDVVVKGLVLGFTRDRRLTLNQLPSNTSNQNPISDLSLFLAPTQSMDASTVGFINKRCGEDNTWNSMIVKVAREVDGKAVSSVQNEFCHICFTFNPKTDSISCYFDGTLVESKPMSEIFSIEKYSMPNIPSLKKANSFEYGPMTVGLDAPTELWEGPKLNQYFTPWVLGGGYTDGMTTRGNFMGGQYGGLHSGLRGYLGSVKFYNRSLGADEIVNNYEAQKNFFKNVRTD